MYVFRYLTLLILLTSVASPVTAGHVAVEAGYQQDNDVVHFAACQQEHEGDQPDMLLLACFEFAQAARQMCSNRPVDKKASSVYNDFYARAPPTIL